MQTLLFLSNSEGKKCNECLLISYLLLPDEITENYFMNIKTSWCLFVFANSLRVSKHAHVFVNSLTEHNWTIHKSKLFLQVINHYIGVYIDKSKT